MTLTFVNRDEIDLDDLMVDLEASGPCDIVAGGRTKERAIERFAETLRFPDWFGRNLDALYDLLDEHAYASSASGTDWTLLWVAGRKLIRDAPRDYAGIVSVLRDVAEADPGAEGAGGRAIVVYGPDPRALQPPDALQSPDAQETTS